MQSISKEINNFIELISQKELSENPNLKCSIKDLLKSVSDYNKLINHNCGVYQYLKKEMFISK